MLITINGKQYTFNFTSWWGALYKYEDLMDIAAHPERKFNPYLTFHMHVMWYAILLCDNEPLDLTLDDFMTALDDMQLHNAMRDYYEQRILIMFPAADVKEEKKSKKKS